MCVSVAVVIYLVVPETAGLKKNEIFKMLRGHKFVQVADHLSKVAPVPFDEPPRDQNIMEERSLK